MSENLPSFGTLELARQNLAALAAGVRAHAAIIIAYAECGDDHGLAYATRCTRAYMRALGGGLKALELLRGTDAFPPISETPDHRQGA